MSTSPSFRTPRRARVAVVVALCAGALVGCEEKSESGAAAAQGSAARGIHEAVEEAADEAVEKAGGSKLFDPSDKAIRKRACEFLTAEMVSKQFGVPAGALKQRQMMGCMYNWDEDDEILDAKLMLIRVHKTEESAKTWFGNATATKTKKQLDSEMDTVKDEVKKREEVDTDLKKKTAVNIADMAKMGMPNEGVQYDDVPGIADQARVSSADGVMWIRLGNMTFQVSAYKGPRQPEMKLDPKNLKGMAKAAMEAQREWIKKTLPDRKAGSKKLAPVVVAAISSATGK